MVETSSRPKERNGLIYVIAGKEDSLVNARCQELLEGLLEPSQRATGLFSVNAAEVCACDILDELRTAPFLTERRVVVVKGADKFISENRQLLERYFDSPCATGILVLTVSNWDARTKLARKLPKVGKLIIVSQPGPWQLPARLSRYARDAHDKNLTKEAVELLIELTGDDLLRLYGEIDKLALFAHTAKVITAGHVELLIGHNRLFNAFTVIDAIADGNAAQAVDRLRRMFADEKSAEYMVVGAFAFHFRRMFNAKVLLEEGANTFEVVRRLGIRSNREGFFAQLRKMSLKQIGDILQRLAGIDYAIKTGRTKPQVAVEQLVLKLVASADIR